MELAYIPKDDRSLGGAGEKYQLIRRIAVGGMAEIFLARAVGIERFEKPVVLKRLLPQFENNAELVAMFLHEARLAAILQHPNIAQVYDIGRKEGAFFFTMEYVHGQTLRAILKAMWDSDTRMPLASALHIGAQLASALHYAHSRCGNDGR
ncbi:MAG TPA: protein kinase, partial [Kofleriaceae bacterium]|nr:protein kinase [Kofleriaceae bacterium]